VKDKWRVVMWQVEAHPEPTMEQVDELHALFLKELEAMYYRHRPEWEDRELSIE
jgi:hypothetical protein